jgi:hypothetical protein
MKVIVDAGWIVVLEIGPDVLVINNEVNLVVWKRPSFCPRYILA